MANYSLDRVVITDDNIDLMREQLPSDQAGELWED